MIDAEGADFVRGDADLGNCDREQIHLPQAIQPHGMFFGLRGPQRHIVAVSENCQALLGCGPDTLLQRTLVEAIGASATKALEASLADPQRLPECAVPLTLTGPKGQSARYEATVHGAKGDLIVELEPCLPPRDCVATPSLGGAVARLRHTENLVSLCSMAASLIRQRTGFDRVVVYRFDSAWNGSVLAEDRSEQVASFLGLHFPASDIPSQARAMYVKNPLRLLVDVDAPPARVIARDAPDAQDRRDRSEPSDQSQPIDMTYATLRSVSPMHREYLRNMRTQASMGISLLRDGALWGIISCSHEGSPLQVPFAVRDACVTIAEVTSLLTQSKEETESYQCQQALQAMQTAALQRRTNTEDFVEALTEGDPNLCHMARATGAAIYYNGRLVCTGKTPSARDVMDLLHWLMQQPAKSLFATQSLPAVYPASLPYKNLACGLMAACLSEGQSNYVLWFRGEVLQTIDWGGNPNKPAGYDPKTMRVHPRRSFELYKETVHLTSLPWVEAEKAAAHHLLRTLIDIVLQKGEYLERLNADLARSNRELDAFAYAASHDLKEPLRGIHNYTELALRELAPDHLVGQSADRLQTVVKLTQRMEDLISSLLHYSHLGRTALTMCAVDIDAVVGHVLEMSKSRMEQTHTELRIPHKLPVVRGDRVLLGELFANLITNAVKYNDKDERWVEVSYVKGSRRLPGSFCVRDNGIGIEKRNWLTIFNIFKRLHARDKYGGGTGTGLTIARRIVERHGGRIWVESKSAQGSAFYFTLAADVARG